MKCISLLTIGICFILTAQCCLGAEAVPLLEPGEIAAIDEETGRTWTLPRLRVGRGRVLLSWEARIAAARASGFREFMRVAINGRPVGARADRLTTRLVNKPDYFFREDGRIRFWYGHEARGWVVVFAPDFESANRQTRYRFEGHAYDFVVDITDLIAQDDANQLEIRNLTTHHYVQKWRKGKPATLFVRNLSVITDAQPPAVRHSYAEQRAAPKLESVALQASGGGGFALVVNGCEYRFDTRLSYPHGGWNRLSAGDKPAGDEPGWRVSIDSGQQLSVRAEGRFYKITRQVHLRGRRVDIEDHVENADAEKRLGLMIAHDLLCPEAMPRCVWMGGSSNPSLNDVGCPQNPTLFVPTGGPGLGVVAQDDVFRLQGKFSYDADARKISIHTDTFALDRGEAYTLRWSIYVVESHDYFSFINRVRADWGVNQTIHGPYAWSQAAGVAHRSPEDLGNCLRESQVKYLCIWSNPSAKHARGKTYVALGAGPFSTEADRQRGDHLQRLKDAVQRVHESGADTKVLLMTNCFKNSVIDGDVSAFADSWYRRADGSIVPYRPEPNKFPTYLIYPTERNAWGKRFSEILDYYLRECGADGIYWDEMSACSDELRLTFGEWDRHSAEIDPETKTIRRPLGLVAMLSGSYCRAQVDHIHGQGKFVHANGASGVRALQTALDSRMVEVKFVTTRIPEVHLITPLAYTYGVPTMQKIRERLMLGGLCFRSHYHTAHPVMTKLFPFTPMELHAGWIKAKERIVTCVSGQFGWQGRFAARVWRFDAESRLLDPDPVVSNYENVGVPVDVPPDGLAIVERIP